jgi:ribosome-interacting GTPase 1
MQVIAVARTADLVLMILDATKKDIHKVCFEILVVCNYCGSGSGSSIWIQSP